MPLLHEHKHVDEAIFVCYTRFYNNKARCVIILNRITDKIIDWIMHFLSWRICDNISKTAHVSSRPLMSGTDGWIYMKFQTW